MFQYIVVLVLCRLLGEVNIPLGEVARSKSSDQSYTLKAKDGSQSKVIMYANWVCVICLMFGCRQLASLEYCCHAT